MRQRGITTVDIQNVVSMPMLKVKRADGRVEYVGISRERQLKVVVDEEQNPAVLVTAFWQE